MRHVTNVPLRWADLDALGHVNSVVYLRYLQEARVDMLFVHARRRGAEQLAEGMVVAAHDIEHHTPLRYRAAPVRVETWVIDVRNAWFTLGYDIADEATGDGGGHERVVFASATSTLVPYDLATQRPRRLDAAEKAVLEGFRESGK